MSGEPETRESLGLGSRQAEGHRPEALSNKKDSLSCAAITILARKHFYCPKDSPMLLASSPGPSYKTPGSPAALLHMCGLPACRLLQWAPWITTSCPAFGLSSPELPCVCPTEPISSSFVTFQFSWVHLCLFLYRKPSPKPLPTEAAPPTTLSPPTPKACPYLPSSEWEAVT